MRNLSNVKIKFYGLIVVVTLIIISAGLTIAYFATELFGSKTTNVEVNISGVSELVFSNTGNLMISASTLNFGENDGNISDTIYSTATLKSSDEVERSYYIFFQINENDFEYTTDDKQAELILYIEDENGNEIRSVNGLSYVTVDDEISGFDITTKSGIYTIVQNNLIATDGINNQTVQTWTFKLYFINMETTQNDNSGKIFSSEIIMSEETIYESAVSFSSSTLSSLSSLSSYNKTTYYSTTAATITSVNCSSGTYSWNYKYNSLDIYNFGENTTCSIEKENETDYETISDHIISLTDVIDEDVEGYVVNETYESKVNYVLQDLTFYTNKTNDESYPWEWDSSTNTWKSTNINVDYDSYLTFTVPNDGYIKIVASISGTSTSWMNKLTVYNGTTEYFKIDSTESTSGEVEVFAGDEIIINFSQDSTYYNGVASIQFYYTTETATINAGYRYEGDNPDNYVYFNGEIWRIIGVFDTYTVDDSGNISSEPEMLTKLINPYSIGDYIWDNDSSDWGGNSTGDSSNLYKILNNNYYNSTDGTNSGYCYLSSTIEGNCNFTKTGISTGYQDFIENVVWYTGGIDKQSVITIFSVDEDESATYVSESSTAEGFYKAERSNVVYAGNSTTATGYIGLMYMSDYGYSVLSNSCSREKSLEGYSNSECDGSSWMMFGGYTRTIVPSISSNGGVWTIDSLYGSETYSIDRAYGVNPVVYLNASVKIISGDGSYENPYVLSIN